ncbi:MAG: Asp-tRNA(Asn)/Glu-tRNA(Gln) amidotransferase subunit GatC [Clostridia bacterium]|nr:Asp-tRNA(Asn)/Glu-tRNA(Gln) amidotransferase subunit GatC [Clostridia bacterium]
MAITREQTAHVADLARLSFDEEELEQVGAVLSVIIAYVNKLGELSTEGVQPTAHALPMVNVYREDEVGPSLTQEEALANAPERDGAFFRVPRIVESAEGGEA